jgi:pimeloyl-ACP methyl ester carboxylesterase
MKSLASHCILFGAAFFAYSYPAATCAQQSMAFSVAKTERTDAIHGQIDWPNGRLKEWKGPIVVFISSGNPIDRDGWLVRALETAWGDRVPLKTLSDALVSEGVAVIRFDNPGVRPPNLECRATIAKQGLNDQILRERCLDVNVLQHLTVTRYLNSIEMIIKQAALMVPKGRRFGLFGFSEGSFHASSIAARHNVPVNALLSIGSPAESIRNASLWQGTSRVIEMLPEFDENGDGIITNEEVRAGYDRGIGHISSTVNMWLSPSGEWHSEHARTFKKIRAAV